MTRVKCCARDARALPSCADSWLNCNSKHNATITRFQFFANDLYYTSSCHRYPAMELYCVIYLSHYICDLETLPVFSMWRRAGATDRYSRRQSNHKISVYTYIVLHADAFSSAIPTASILIASGWYICAAGCTRPADVAYRNV